MKRVLAICAMSAFLLAACGDDESSGFTTRPDEDSSSSVCEDCDDSSSSKAKSSSSSAKSSSSEKKPCVVGKDKNCFEDERDGQTYRTVKIGTQIWMAENLNFKVGNSACYDDEKSNCTKYGRLYTWGAAIDSVGKYGENAKGCGNGEHCTPIPPVRGICPEGWHLPDTIEWRVLIDVAGGEDDAGKALKSKSGWKNDGNGTDEFGFSATTATAQMNSDSRHSLSAAGSAAVSMATISMKAAALISGHPLIRIASWAGHSIWV